MEELIVKAFVTIVVVIDPVGTAAVFAALTHGADARRRRAMALRGTLLATLILVVFAVLGEALLEALSIGLPAFRVAGGILLLLAAIDMVFARPSGVRGTTDAEEAEAMERDDISVFPLAFPLIAGPGAMTTVLLFAGRGGGDPVLLGAFFGVLLAALALTLVALLMAGRIATLLGVTGTNVIGRIFGVILAALAAQFIIDGLRVSFGLG